MLRHWTILFVMLALAGPVFSINQSQAITIKFGPMYDATDGVTPRSNLTLHANHIELSKNGGAFAAKHSTTAPTYDKDGYYNVHFDDADTDTLGILTAKWYDPNVVSVPQEYLVVTPTAYASLTGSGIWPTNVTQWNSSAVPTPDTVGYPKVTVKSGTGPGEVVLTAGRADSDVKQWNGATSTLANFTNVYATAFSAAFDDTNDVWNARTKAISKAAGLAAINDVQTEAEQAIDAKKDAIADKVWVNEPNSVRLVAIKGVTDKVDTAMESDVGVYRFTLNALEQSPAPSGATDWTDAEKEQFRSALGVNGTKTAATGGQLQSIKTPLDKLDTMLEADGATYRFTLNSVELAPSSTGGGWTPIRKATAQAGTLFTVTLDTGASATSSIYRGNRIVIYGGTGAGQSNLISTYNGTSKVVTTLWPWVVAPSSDSLYEIQAADGELLRNLQGLWK